MTIGVCFEETLQVGGETYLACDSGQNSYSVVFEDDGVTGYFYACVVGGNGAVAILDAVHIYNVKDVIDKDVPSKLTIAWSQTGQQAILLINDYPHAVFDFAKRYGYCRTGFPSVKENSWCQNDHQWSDKALECFK